MSLQKNRNFANSASGSDIFLFFIADKSSGSNTKLVHRQDRFQSLNRGGNFIDHCCVIPNENINTNKIKFGKEHSNIITNQSWLFESKSKINETSKLCDNWNDLGSDAPNLAARKNAETVLSILHEENIKPNYVGPSAENGIAFSFVSNSNYSILECYNDGAILIANSRHQELKEIFETGTSYEELKETIKYINSFING